MVFEVSYRTLVWLTYRLAATFALGLPLVLLIWAYIKKESAIIRLLTIYWKVSSILIISMLLLTDAKPMGYLLSIFSPFLIVSSIWFWIDLNEELFDISSFRALPLTVKIWRWCLTLWGVLSLYSQSKSISCFINTKQPNCYPWLEVPKAFHQINERLFGFLFGANWEPSLASFVGYLILIAYIIGLIQWLFIRLPKNGRIAGDF